MGHTEIAQFIRANPDWTAKDVAKAHCCTASHVRSIARRNGLKLKPGKRKYGNSKVEVDGITFDSKAEAKRYDELKVLEKAGKIGGLRLQPRFPLGVPDSRSPEPKAQIIIGEYRADFAYFEDKQHVIEDVKGKETALFKWKRKHFEAEYGIKLRVIK